MLNTKPYDKDSAMTAKHVPLIIKKKKGKNLPTQGLPQDLALKFHDQSEQLWEPAIHV